MHFSEKYYPDMKETLFFGNHESGLKVFVLPKKGFTKSYAILGTNFGSVNNSFTINGEKIDLPDGIAHFLEHKMFDQEDGSSVFDKFSEYGANANAFTSFTMTAYLFSATENFYENLETLFDYTLHPYYTDETVDKEQGIIGQEIRMYDDDPDWNVYFNALRAMYQVNPCNIDIAGTTESIAKITKETLYTCYNTFYHPNNMVLFCVGAVDKDKVGKMCDALIPKVEPWNEPINHFPKEPNEVATPIIEEHFDIGTPQFSVAFKDNNLPSYGNEALLFDAQMSVLAEIFAGRGSRLYNELYEKNLANNSFSSFYEGELSYAFLMISGESSDPRKVYEIIKEEAKRLRTEGIDPDTFDRAKRVVYARAVSLFDKQESFANSFCSFAVKGADVMEYPAYVEKITLSDIEKRLGVLNEDLCVLSAIYPKGE